MRFLGVGDAADLGALYLRLAEEGHDVKVCIGHQICRDTPVAFHPASTIGEPSSTGSGGRRRRLYPVRKCRRGTRRNSRTD